MHVYIFALPDKRKASVFNISLYFRQGSHNLLAFNCSEKPDPCKHVCVGYRSLNVLLEKPAVEGDRLRELFDSMISFAVKTAAPGLIGHSSHPRVASSFCA